MENGDTGPALKFEVLGKWNKARASILTLPHHTVKTPVFMPVGTQGSIKGLTSKQVQEVIILFSKLTYISKSNFLKIVGM